MLGAYHTLFLSTRDVYDRKLPFVRNHSRDVLSRRILFGKLEASAGYREFRVFISSLFGTCCLGRCWSHAFVHFCYKRDFRAKYVSILLYCCSAIHRNRFAMSTMVLRCHANWHSINSWDDCSWTLIFLSKTNERSALAQRKPLMIQAGGHCSCDGDVKRRRQNYWLQMLLDCTRNNKTRSTTKDSVNRACESSPTFTSICFQHFVAWATTDKQKYRWPWVLWWILSWGKI